MKTQINAKKYFQKVTDVGGSMVIHMFGAYFGLAVSRLIYREEHGEENDKEGSVYHSDVFAMIGKLQRNYTNFVVIPTDASLCVG